MYKQFYFHPVLYFKVEICQQRLYILHDNKKKSMDKAALFSRACTCLVNKQNNKNQLINTNTKVHGTKMWNSLIQFLVFQGWAVAISAGLKRVNIWRRCKKNMNPAVCNFLLFV